MLEGAIQIGRPFLIENVTEKIDPALEPILLKNVYTKANVMYLKMGEKAIEYHPDFTFYMTTKPRNPHYLPEISTKVTLINFMITQEALNDQLLGILVQKERPELEEKRDKLLTESAENARIMSELEDQIL